MLGVPLFTTIRTPTWKERVLEVLPGDDHMTDEEFQAQLSKLQNALAAKDAELEALRAKAAKDRESILGQFSKWLKE
jgi:transposase